MRLLMRPKAPFSIASAIHITIKKVIPFYLGHKKTRSFNFYDRAFTQQVLLFTRSCCTQSCYFIFNTYITKQHTITQWHIRSLPFRRQAVLCCMFAAMLLMHGHLFFSLYLTTARVCNRWRATQQKTPLIQAGLGL